MIFRMFILTSRSSSKNKMAILMEKASWFLQQVERPRPYEERAQLVEQCVSDNEEGALALLFVPKGLLLLIGTLAAWPARRLCIPLCNNTRNCALCLVIAAVMCIIEIPIIMHVRQYPNPFYGITGLIIMVVSVALLVIGVVPQVSSNTVFTTTAEISRAHWLIFIVNKWTDTWAYNLCDVIAKIKTNWRQFCASVLSCPQIL